MAHNAAPSLEAKLVILGAQSVGKTSLVHRYVKNSFIPPNKSQSTIGASFLTTRVHDPESGATIRLQIWDTAGQERFRSISKLYYRGADAAILCYDVSDRGSFEEMGRWLAELREHTSLGTEGFPIVLHVVGTKTDLVAAEPSRREVPFEKCIGYVAEQLYPEQVAATGCGRPDGAAAGLGAFGSFPPPAVTIAGTDGRNVLASPQSNRSSGFWGSEAIWDCCHEVSSKDGEGIDEVFRVITRKLVDQHTRKMEALQDAQLRGGKTPGLDGSVGAPGYFDLPGAGQGSFKLGHGDKRRSWLGFPGTPGGFTSYSNESGDAEIEGPRGTRKGRCC